MYVFFEVVYSYSVEDDVIYDVFCLVIRRVSVLLGCSVVLFFVEENNLSVKEVFNWCLFISFCCFFFLLLILNEVIVDFLIIEFVIEEYDLEEDNIELFY